MTTTLVSSVTSADTYSFDAPRYIGARMAQIADETITVHAGESISRLSNARLLKFAATHRPPQSWYDEDMEGLY